MTNRDPCRNYTSDAIHIATISYYLARNCIRLWMILDMYLASALDREEISRKFYILHTLYVLRTVDIA